MQRRIFTGHILAELQPKMEVKLDIKKVSKKPND